MVLQRLSGHAGDGRCGVDDDEVDLIRAVSTRAAVATTCCRTTPSGAMAPTNRTRSAAPSEARSPWSRTNAIRCRWEDRRLFGRCRHRHRPRFPGRDRRASRSRASVDFRCRCHLRASRHRGADQVVEERSVMTVGHLAPRLGRCIVPAGGRSAAAGILGRDDSPHLVSQ